MTRELLFHDKCEEEDRVSVGLGSVGLQCPGADSPLRYFGALLNCANRSHKRLEFEEAPSRSTWRPARPAPAPIPNPQPSMVAHSLPTGDQEDTNGRTLQAGSRGRLSGCAESSGRVDRPDARGIRNGNLGGGEAHWPAGAACNLYSSPRKFGKPAGTSRVEVGQRTRADSGRRFSAAARKGTSEKKTAAHFAKTPGGRLGSAKRVADRFVRRRRVASQARIGAGTARDTGRDRGSAPRVALAGAGPVPARTASAGRQERPTRRTRRYGVTSLTAGLASWSMYSSSGPSTV